MHCLSFVNETLYAKIPAFVSVFIHTLTSVYTYKCLPLCLFTLKFLLAMTHVFTVTSVYKYTRLHTLFLHSRVGTCVSPVLVFSLNGLKAGGHRFRRCPQR